MYRNNKINIYDSITFRSGISLITLIITIIVIIILAGVVIANLNNRNVINSAVDARTLNNLSTIKEELEYYRLNKYSPDFNVFDLYPLQKDENGNYITLNDLDDNIKNNFPIDLKMILYDTERYELDNYNNLPDISLIDYSKFYKIDTSLLTSAKTYDEDLYIYIYDLGYVIFNINGVKYKENTEYSIIPLGSTFNSEYIALTNNTFKLYGNGDLKVLGQINSITGETTDENKQYSGIKELVIPDVIQEPENIKKIYFSMGTAYVIDKDDNLWAWGSNTFNKLGLGNSFTVTSPIKINENIKADGQAIKVKNVWAGNTNTWIVDTQNRVWACGSNASGSFGVGNTNTYSGWVNVSSLDGSKIKQIQPNLSDTRYTFVICTDGRVFASGSNSNGYFGKNDYANTNTFVELPNFYGAKKILAGGSRDVFILKESGDLYGVGSNLFAGLGLPGNSKYSVPVQIASNVEDMDYVDVWRGTIRYKSVDGYIYQSGIIKYDTLGSPIYESYFRQVENVSDANLFLASNGLFVSNGKMYTVSYNSQTDKLTSSAYASTYSNITDKETFNGMRIFKISNKIYIDSQPDVTAIGKRVRLSFKNAFSNAQFVQGASNNISIVDKDLNIWESLKSKNTELTNVKKIISSNTAKYALLKNGELYAKGTSSSGGWGDALSRSTYTLITKDGTIPFSVKDVYTSIYGNTAIFLTNENELYWFGNDAHIYLPQKEAGDILLSDNNHLTKYPHKINTTGLNEDILSNIADIVYDVNWNDFYSKITYVLTTSGELYVTGDSPKTTGLNASSANFTKITAFGDTKVKSIKTYQGCVLALLEDGKVYGWGYNTYGQFGNGYNIGANYPTPQRLSLNSNIIKITLGDGFAIFLTTDGSVYGSGRNEYGQLGTGSNNSTGTFVRCTELEK